MNNKEKNSVPKGTKEQVSEIFKEANKVPDSSTKPKPNLDYYDNLRDPEGQYKGKYGKYKKD